MHHCNCGNTFPISNVSTVLYHDKVDNSYHIVLFSISEQTC